MFEIPSPVVAKKHSLDVATKILLSTSERAVTVKPQEGEIGGEEAKQRVWITLAGSLSVRRRENEN